MLALIKKGVTKFGVRAVAALDGLLAAVILIYLYRHGVHLPESEANFLVVAFLFLGVSASLLAVRFLELLAIWLFVWGSLSGGFAVALVLGLLALILNPGVPTTLKLTLNAAGYFSLTGLNFLAVERAYREARAEREQALVPD